MELVTKKMLRLYSGSTHPALAEEIATHLGVPLGEPNLRRFANGEYHCRFAESVRGTDVFVVQTHCETDGRSVNDSLMEQLIMIDAAKRASAKRITAVCPYYGYSRQDRKAEGREPVTAKLVADLLTAAGADRMVSVDLHSGQIQGFFDVPVDHLRAEPVLLDYVRREVSGDPGSASAASGADGLDPGKASAASGAGGLDVVLVSPDAGRVKVAERFAQHLGSDLAFVYKRHVKGKANVVEARRAVGPVEGKRCVIVDDMIDTGGTIIAACDILLDEGATEVWAMATHGLFSGTAIDRLKNSNLSRVVVTNTVPIPADKQIDKIEALSIAGVIADAIEAVFSDTSVSEIFGGENQG